MSSSTALIGIDDLGLAVPGDRQRQCLYAEVGMHRVGEPPGQNLSAVPVHHRHRNQEAAAHRQVRDIDSPDLTGAIDFQSKGVRNFVCEA
jgi:hypothetical protein